MKRILLVVLAFSLVLSGCGKDEPTTTETTNGTEGTIGDTLTYGALDITLDDAYYANFPHEGIDLNFDRYLAADLKITNNSSDPVVAKTLNSFTVYDDKENLSRVMIDENQKKFSKSLMTGDEFDITLVFPVMESNEYTLYYSDGAATKKENVLSWTFEIGNRAVGEVDETIEHRKVEDVVKTFLFGDGSKKIAFDAKPKSSETASEVVSNSPSDVASEVKSDE